MIEIKENDNSFSFTVETEGGQVLMVGKEAENINEIENAISLLKDIRTLVFERKTNHSGSFLFNVKNMEGQYLGSSKTYRSEAGMENGIKNLRTILTKI